MTRRATPDQVLLRPLGEVLQSLAELNANWDSYGAIPPSPAALERAWHYASALVERGLAMPEVFPTRSGGVQLEWHTESVEFEWEIDTDGATGVFIFDDHRSGEKIDGELPYESALLTSALLRLARG